jgi:hypothetical protein
MILNPDLIAPEEHNISKWRTFLPPVVDFNVTKKLKNIVVSKIFENKDVAKNI